jgi:hypothetical protein
MPIEATPLLHDVLAVAEKWTGEETVEPLPGAVTVTPAKADVTSIASKKTHV